MLEKKKWQRFWCKVMAVLMTVLIFVPLIPTVVLAVDEYDGLREKYKTKLTGYDSANPYDPDDTYIKLSLEKLDISVNKWWASMDKTIYTWNDKKDSSATIASDVNDIISRLKTMAMGWATYGSTYYGNTTLLSDTINGLEWFYNNRYNETTNWYSTTNDWWFWEIGVPINLNDTVILLYDQLTSSQRTNYMNAIDRWSPDVYTSTIIPNSMTGANRTWKCKVVGIRAIIVKDSVKLQAASDGLDDVFQYSTSGDGFYTDGSFIQHGDIPYAGSYGNSLFCDTSEILWLLAGSSWDNNSSYRDNVYKWFFDTFEPVMYKGGMFESTKGRTISRAPSKPITGFDNINALLMLVEIPSNPYIDIFNSIIKYHLQNGYIDSYFRTNSRWIIVKAKKILDDAQVSPAAELTGNYQFYNEDRIAHRSQGWAFDIAMHSNRIRNYETINNENLKGWYMGDGMTYLYLNPSDYSFNFWPTVDPHRLPGITVDRDTSRPNSTSNGTKSTNSWIGGVSLEGTYGTAGMDLKQHNYSNMDLTAKKSWFMFDDEFVSLGAGINSMSGRTIETVVDNRFLNSQGNNSLTVDEITKSSSLGWSEIMDDVSWIQLDGTGGYVFPSGTSIKGLRERRESNWFDLNHTYYDKANDEFNSSAQGSAWMWVREDNTKHSLSGTTLDIITQQGTLEGATNSAKNILLADAPQYDFYSETKFSFSPTVEGQEAGLILYADDDNYVYISRVYTASSQRIKAISESGATVTSNTFSDTYGATVYFKIEKCSNDYLLYVSSDGQSWGTALYTYTNAMAGTDGVNSNLRMGLFAQNGENPSASEITASFDFFHLKLVRNYLTLWLDHGVNPSNASYSYITLPNKTAEETKSYSSNPDISILRNDTTVQAVKEETLGIIGANFWNYGSISYITAYNPAAVMVKDQNGQLDISVSDPTHLQSKVRVELSKSGLSTVSSDSTVTVLQMSPTIILEVDVSGDDATKGKSHNITISYDPLAPTLPPRTYVELSPGEDAYVRDGSYADTNYGSNTSLVVKNSGTPNDGTNREAFLKFDMNSINEEIVIESAKLHFYGKVVESSETGVDVKAYGVDDDSWTETGITWNNKPVTGACLGTVHVDDKMEWREIDVTSYVQSQYVGDKKVSLSLRQDVRGLYSDFSSKENSIYKPYLEITAAYPAKLINPEADSYVRDGAFSETNYGTNSVLAVKSNNAGYNRQTYLKFDLSADIGEIASAKLYVHGMVNDGNGTEEDNKVYSVDDDTWAENSITWNNKPSVRAYLSTAHETNQPAWSEFDVTSYVQAQNAGDKKASFVILQDTPTGLYTDFKSKESLEYKPCLQIITCKKINPEADSYVRDGEFLDTNYGTDSVLAVKNNAEGYNRKAYLKFDLSSVVGEITSVKLYTYGMVTDGIGTEVDNKVFGVDEDNWTETGITWNNSPVAGTYLSTVHFNSQPAWREFDVTSYVQTQKAGDKKVSFVIFQDVPAGLFTHIKSKEDAEYKPYLKVSYSQP